MLLLALDWRSGGGLLDERAAVRALAVRRCANQHTLHAMADVRLINLMSIDLSFAVGTYRAHFRSEKMPFAAAASVASRPSPPFAAAAVAFILISIACSTVVLANDLEGGRRYEPSRRGLMRDAARCCCFRRLLLLPRANTTAAPQPNPNRRRPRRRRRAAARARRHAAL